MKKTVFGVAFTIAIGLSATASAQRADSTYRKLIVADIETRIPIRNVMVITNTGYRDTTNYRGECLLPAQYDTVIVYKPNYLSEKMARSEVKDSTYLIPSNHRISEVTVWGEDRTRRINEAVRRWSNKAAEEGAGNAPHGIVSFDFMQMFDKRANRDKKQLRKTRQAFSEFDRKGNEDPIEAAYNRTLEQKRLEEEMKKKAEETLKAQQNKEQQKVQQDIDAYKAAGKDEEAKGQ